MSDLDVAILGAVTQAADGTARVQATLPIANDNGGPDEVEPFGEIQVMQGLGFASAPWPADDNGHAEGVVVRDCGGRNAICIGGRDTRTAGIIGALQPGDTCVHSTGPQQSAQLLLKEKKRQAVLATKGTDKKQIVVLLDGKNDKVQIMAFGGTFEMSKSGGGCQIVLNTGKGAGLQMVGDTIVFDGKFMPRSPTGPVLIAATAGIPSTGGLFG